MVLPAPVPEIPVANIDPAVAYYVEKLGFEFDWGDEAGGIACVSRGSCRLFLTSQAFRAFKGNVGAIVLWLNLDSRAEVDKLYAEWRSLGAALDSEPEDKPYWLREFVARDGDDNMIRVFYDFSSDEPNP